MANPLPSVLLIGALVAALIGSGFFLTAQQLRKTGETGVGGTFNPSSSQTTTATTAPVVSTSPPVAVNSPSATPTIVNTSDWQVYTSPTNFGFSFKYPKGWYYQTIRAGTVTAYGITLSDQEPPFVTAPGKRLPVSLNISLLRTDLTAKEYADTDLAEKKATLNSSEVILVDGVEGLQYASRLDGTLYLSAYLRRGDYLYIFEGIASDASKEAELSEVFGPLVNSMNF